MRNHMAPGSMHGRSTHDGLRTLLLSVLCHPNDLGRREAHPCCCSSLPARAWIEVGCRVNRHFVATVHVAGEPVWPGSDPCSWMQDILAK